MPRELTGHSGEVTCLAFNTTGAMLYSGSRDGTIRAWNLSLMQSSPLHQGEAWLRTLERGEQRLAAGFSDGELHLWRGRDNHSHRLGAHPGGADALAFSPDGRLLFSGGRDGMLRFWDVRRGVALHGVMAHDRPLLALALHPGGAWLASGGGDNWIHLWALA